MGQLAGCAFLLTSETTGESHVLVTDENGMFDSAASWVPHTRGTDGNDAALSAAGSVDDEGLDASRGVWFGAGTKADDSLGALPYDTYDLSELPCAANAGHALTERTVTISRDRTDLDIGTVDDKQVSIRTEATDAATGTHESEAAAKQTIVDTVSYANLTPGKEYELTGTLVDKATGKAVQSGGADVTATTTFTPEEPDGTAQVTFEFDGTSTAGRTLVAFESLSQDGREVATHADVDDEGQTVTVPKVGTEATGKASGTHEEQATGRTEIVDTVSYANLVPGRSTRSPGPSWTRPPARRSSPEGADVTATTTFTPEEADGTAQVTFELDASALAGTTTVAFETLSREGREVATHADISDAGQTVSLVGVGTKAADEATGTNEGTPADRVTIVDTVSYTGLTPGKEYVLTGDPHGRLHGEGLAAGRGRRHRDDHAHAGEGRRHGRGRLRDRRLGARREDARLLRVPLARREAGRRARRHLRRGPVGLLRVAPDAPGDAARDAGGAAQDGRRPPGGRAARPARRRGVRRRGRMGHAPQGRRGAMTFIACFVSFVAGGTFGVAAMALAQAAGAADREAERRAAEARARRAR
jgi:hypothetical protein